MGKRDRIRTAILLIAFGTGCLQPAWAQTDPTSAQGNSDPYLQSVYAHLCDGSVGLTQAQCEEVRRGQLVREVKKWPFQDKLAHHRLFVIPRGSSFNRGAILVAVAADLLPFSIDDARDFNELLQKESVLIESTEDARDAGELFLKCYRVTYVMDYGYDLGVNVVRTLDDISFRNEEEKAALAKQFQIEPPKISREGDGYQYTFYSWEQQGSGLLEHHEVAMNRKGIVNYRTVRLKTDVGLWVGFR